MCIQWSISNDFYKHSNVKLCIQGNKQRFFTSLSPAPVSSISLIGLYLCHEQNITGYIRNKIIYKGKNNCKYSIHIVSQFLHLIELIHWFFYKRKDTTLKFFLGLFQTDISVTCSGQHTAHSLDQKKDHTTINSSQTTTMGTFTAMKWHVNCSTSHISSKSIEERK
jgi:hypothetical protein